MKYDFFNGIFNLVNWKRIYVQFITESITDNFGIQNNIEFYFNRWLVWNILMIFFLLIFCYYWIYSTSNFYILITFES